MHSSNTESIPASLLVKAYYRAAKACFLLKKFEESLEGCERGLEVRQLVLFFIIVSYRIWMQIDPQNSTLNELKQQIMKQMEEERKKTALAKERESELAAKRHRFEQALASRKIQIAGGKLNLRRDDSNESSKSTFSPGSLFSLPDSFDYKPEYDEQQNSMTWPVVLIYPKECQVDTIMAWEESIKMKDMIQEVLPVDHPCDWDTERAYHLDKIAIYYPCASKDPQTTPCVWKRAPLLRSLGQVLSDREFVLANDGVVRLWVVPRHEGTTAPADWTRHWLKHEK